MSQVYFSSSISLIILGIALTGCTSGMTTSGTLSGTSSSQSIPSGSTDSNSMTVPQNLSASSSSSGINLSWSYSGSSRGFIIERKSSNGTDSYIVVGNVAAGFLQFFDSSNLDSNWQYNYVVLAVGASGNSNPSSIATIQYVGTTSNPTPIPVATPQPSPGSNPQPSPTPVVSSTPTGTVFNISAGASTSTIQSTINSAAASGSASTVLFAAGNYSITSQITIPCPKASMTISGPAVAYPAYPVAALKSGFSTWMFSAATCTNGGTTTLQYLELNGNHPSGDGGGSLFLPTSAANFIFQYNYSHGNSASTADGNEYDSLVWMDGYTQAPADKNITIQWNRFGASGDCNAIMNTFRYQGSSYDGVGGYCAGIGAHNSMTNVTINNNVFFNLEQGMKFYEGGSGPPNLYYEINVTVSYNDFSNIHRIGFEAQMTGTEGNGMYVTNNDYHDAVMPGWGTWGFSVPQTGPITHTGNVMIANTPTTNYYPGAFEFWGDGACNNNLIQGFWGTGIAWGWGVVLGSTPINNNILQVKSGAYIGNEENRTGGNPVTNGNSETTSVSAQTSAAPKISISGTTVTMSDSGNSGVGPQGNTSIWYTTDGTNPVPGSSKYYSGAFTVSSGTQVKAVGMWGALNQPTSYPSGYGYVPSSVVSATAQ